MAVMCRKKGKKIVLRKCVASIQGKTTIFLQSHFKDKPNPSESVKTKFCTIPSSYMRD